MAGLLDLEQDDPLNYGLLSAAQGLLTPPARGGGLGAAFGGFGNAVQNAQNSAMRRRLMESQIGENASQAEQRKAAAEAARQNAARILAIQQFIGGASGPKDINAASLARVGANPDEIKHILESINYNPDPITSTITGTGAGGKGESTFGVRKSGGITDLGVAPREQRPLVNVAMGANKEWMKGIVEDIRGSAVDARNAVGALDAIKRIEDVIDKGVIVGPGQTFRQNLSRVGQMIGVGGKDEAERLANTAQLVQGMADLSLKASSSIKGQGQVSNFERELLTRASSGDMNFTQAEVKSLINVMGRINRAKITNHQNLIKNIPEEIKGFSDFYNVDAPDFGPSLAVPPPSPTPRPRGGRRINDPINWGDN